MYEDSEVWFHYHVRDATCTPECYAVPKNPGMEPRAERMEHNHVFQAPHESYYPECPACRSITPYRMEFRYAAQEKFKLSGGWT